MDRVHVFGQSATISRYVEQEPCPFEYGLKKFALDPVLVIWN